MAALKQKTKTQKYRYYKNRLDSFHTGVVLGKAKKLVAWPDSHLNIDSLASLGFFYQPTLTHKDQIQCFFCSKKIHNLKEMTVDTILEKLSCSFTKLVRFIKDKDDADSVLDDPMNSESIKIRLSTFDAFPHSMPTGESLAKAGFIFTPAAEEDDSTTCIYCLCILDGWEKGDDPLAEHRLRNSHCKMFASEYSSSSEDELDEVPSKNDAILVPSSDAALSDDDFALSSQLNSQAQKPKNRYGTSKIKKNRIVTSSSNPSSSFANLSQRQVREKRRSWYREEGDKKRKSDEFLSDSELEIDTKIVKKAKDNETAGVQDKLDNVIEHDFKEPFAIPTSPLAQSPIRVIANGEEPRSMDSPVRPLPPSPPKLPSPRRSTRRTRSSKPDLEEKLVENSELLDAISTSHSIVVQAPTKISEKVFDHQADADDEPLGPPEEQNETLGPPEEQNGANEIEEKVESTPRAKVPDNDSNSISEVDDTTQEVVIGRRSRRAAAITAEQSFAIGTPVKSKLDEKAKKAEKQTPLKKETKAEAKKTQPKKPTRKTSIGHKPVETKTEELVVEGMASRTRTRTSMVPLKSPLRFEYIEESKPVVKKSSLTPVKSTDKTTTADRKGKLAKAKKSEIKVQDNKSSPLSTRRRIRSSIVPPTVSNNVKEEKESTPKRRKKSAPIDAPVELPKKTTRSRSKKRDSLASSDVIENEAENESEPLNPARLNSKKGTSSGSLIGSPDTSDKTVRNKKRIILMKMIKDRHAKLFNNNQSSSDLFSGKEPPKPKDKRKDSLLNKSPMRSPLKMNKLIDASDAVDIFSRSSPVRPSSVELEVDLEKEFPAVDADELAKTEEEVVEPKAVTKIEKESTPSLQYLLTPVLQPVQSEASLEISPVEATIAPTPAPATVPTETVNDEQNSEDIGEENHHLVEKLPIKVIDRKPSLEGLDFHYSSPSLEQMSQSSSTRLSQLSRRSTLRLSIPPLNFSDQPTVVSPINTARFEISKVDDDVILADNDIQSGEATGKFKVPEKIEFEESSRRTSKLIPNGEDSVFAKEITGEVEEDATGELVVPGVIAEFNESTNLIADPTEKDIHDTNENISTPQKVSIEECESMKVSTPLNLMGADAESTSLEIKLDDTVDDKKDEQPEVDVQVATEVPEAPEEIQDNKAPEVVDQHQLTETTLNGDKSEAAVEPLEKELPNSDQDKVEVEESQLKWDPAEPTLLNQIISDIESSGEFFTKITNSKYGSLNEDLEGELTDFIAQMPDEELDMTVKQWMMHNAVQLRAILESNMDQMINLFKMEGEKLLQVLENLPVKENDEDGIIDDNEFGNNKQKGNVEIETKE